MNCNHCQAETSNGLALCELCRRKVTTDLEFLPIYFTNLARWRPGRAGARPVPSSREPQGLTTEPTDRVSMALDEAGSALTTWARMLSDDRGIQPPQADGEVDQATVLCQWLAENLTSIATLEWCGEFMGAEGDDGIGYHEAKLRRLTERVAPGWYAGECRRCEAPTFVVPGLTWVTCGGCGVTTFARDHLEAVLREARGWVARPMRLAEAIVALVDTEQSVPRLHKRISKWGETRTARRMVEGQMTTVVTRLPIITPIRRLDEDGDEVGPKRFMLGDVLDHLMAEGETRTGTLDAAAS